MTFQQRQAKLDYYNSPEFTQAEKDRKERSQPTTHVPVDFNRVWCPVYSKVRPEWLCANEHGGDRMSDGSDEQGWDFEEEQ